MEVSFGHDRLDDIDCTCLDEGLTRDGPLGKVEDNEKRKVLQAVGGPAGRGSGGGTDILDDALGNISLTDESGIVFALGKILDQTASPTNTFGTSRAGLGCSGGVGKELFEDAKERFGVLKGRYILAIRARRMLQNGGDACFEEGKVHKTDATQVRLLLIFGDNLAKSSDNFLGGWSKGHDTLVLGGDRKVVKSKTGKVTTISTFLCQALCEGCENVVLSTADHRDTVLLMTNITQFVNALGSGGALFSLGTEHSFDEIGDVIKRRGLGGGTLCGWCLLV